MSVYAIDPVLLLTHIPKLCYMELVRCLEWLQHSALHAIARSGSQSLQCPRVQNRTQRDVPKTSVELKITQHSVQLSTSFLLLVPRPKIRLGLRRTGHRLKLMKTIAVVAAFLLTASAQSLEVRSRESTLLHIDITQPWTYRGCFEASDGVRWVCLCPIELCLVILSSCCSKL